MEIHESICLTRCKNPAALLLQWVSYVPLNISKSAWDTNLCAANPLYLAVNLETGGGGAFAVIPLSETGRLREDYPVFNGHTASVLDTAFNPFNDSIVASASEDCKAMIWKIPEGGLTESCATPAVVLNGHGRKVGHVVFNSCADNILATSSTDFTVKIWDISTGQEKFQLTGFAEIIQSVVWNGEGNLLFTACKDKKLRIFDVRTGTIVQEGNGHVGVKGSRIAAMGTSTNFVTTGFSRTSDRQVYIWDQKNMSEPIKKEDIDTASGLLIPVFDEDTSMLYLAGKGDGNIRYYEWSTDDNSLFYLEQYQSKDALRGLAFLPKRACNINDCEVARIFKVHPTMIEPISFKVPRKSDQFQADLFPDTVGPDPSMTATQWLAGANKPPKKISLEKGFVAAAPKEFVTTASEVSTGQPSVVQKMTEKEYQDGYHALKKENEELSVQIASKDARIRQLEAQLAQMQAK